MAQENGPSPLQLGTIATQSNVPDGWINLGPQSNNDGERYRTFVQTSTPTVVSRASSGFAAGIVLTVSVSPSILN